MFSIREISWEQVNILLNFSDSTEYSIESYTQERKQKEHTVQKTGGCLCHFTDICLLICVTLLVKELNI